MTLLKTINANIQRGESIFESTGMSDFFDKEGYIIKESISGFVGGAKKLIDTLHVDGENLALHEPTEVEIRKLDKFALMLAGLEYFRQKNVGTEERVSLASVLDDENITNYVKKMALEKAEDIVAEIKTHFYKGKILRREGLDKMIEDIRKFYLSKKANVGTLLHVQHQEE